ncbi:unnamed protein product [Leuciscus chuanchicus]
MRERQEECRSARKAGSGAWAVSPPASHARREFSTDEKTALIGVCFRQEEQLQLLLQYAERTIATRTQRDLYTLDKRSRERLLKVPHRIISIVCLQNQICAQPHMLFQSSVTSPGVHARLNAVSADVGVQQDKLQIAEPPASPPLLFLGLARRHCFCPLSKINKSMCQVVCSQETMTHF